MKSLIIGRPARIAGLLALLVAVPLAVSLSGCTDLEEQPFNSVTPDNFYSTPEEILAAVAPVYAQLREFQWSYHEISELSSDEAVVPVRGQDWLDNGIHLQMHRHQWAANHSAIEGAWNGAFTGVARANTVLQTLENAEVANKETIVAELKALRAFYYYQLLDLFDNIPIVGDDEFTMDPLNPAPSQSRAELFAFVVAELQEAREVLPTPDVWGGAGVGRMTQGAADAILANMFINARVFTNGPDGINADSYNSCMDAAAAANACQQAYDYAMGLINSPDYSLLSNFHDNFVPANAAAAEHIFAVGYLAEQDLGLQFPHKTLHYNQLTPSPWNGWATLAETYNEFSAADERREVLLAGQAYHTITGEPVENRQGEPLIFTPDIGNIEGASEGAGIRIMKYPVDPDHFEQHNGNDYAIFRLAEMYLIAAEAANELGRTGEAVGLLNDLRERAFEPDQPLTDPGNPAAVRELIKQERLYELFFEAKRRQDLIRFGDWTDEWTFKTSSDICRAVFPVPQNQLDANENLVQIPCYQAGG